MLNMIEKIPEIVRGFLIFAIVVALVMWWKGPVQPDLSSDFEEAEGQYYEGGGSGHPLWNN